MCSCQKEPSLALPGVGSQLRAEVRGWAMPLGCGLLGVKPLGDT